MLGLALGLGFLAGFGLGFPAFAIATGLGLLGLARNSLSPASLIGISIVTLLGAWYAAAQPGETLRIPVPGNMEGMVRIVDGPYLTSSGQRFLGRLESQDSALLCIYGPSQPTPYAGDRVFVEGRVTLLADLSDIGEAAARARGCDAQLRVETMRIIETGAGWSSHIARFRVELSEFLMQASPGDAGALMSGLVTEEDGGLSDSASEAFVNSGTTHITAISGANFSLLIILLGVLVTGAARRSLLFVAGASTAIWLYALMVGLQPSALRAALLATAVLVGRSMGRKPDLLTLTILLAAVQIVLRPQDFTTLAFQLSVAATVALILVFDGSETSAGRPWVLTLCLAVLAAQLATIPILAWRIGTLTGVGMVANLIVGQLAELAFPIALVGGLVGQLNEALGRAVLVPAVALSDGILTFVEWIDRHFPGAVALGPPTFAAIAMITLACWTGIFILSGDLRRATRHVVSVARSW